MTKMNDSEKDLYPIIEDFLIKEKDCFKDYVGTELPLGNKVRVDVYGVKNEQEKIITYLLEGKLYLDKKPFGNVIFESISCLDYANYTYVFGKKTDNFESNNEKYIEECQAKGMGILLIDGNKQVEEYLEPKKIITNNFSNKEAVFRIFNRTVEKPIADFILQATYELYLKTNNKCAKFIDIYNALFSKEEYKEILNRILKGEHVLNEQGMRGAFQRVYGPSYYVGITGTGKRIENQICINDKTKEKVKPAILLDY